MVTSANWKGHVQHLKMDAGNWHVLIPSEPVLTNILSMSRPVDMFSHLADSTMCFQHVFFRPWEFACFFFGHEILDACNLTGKGTRAPTTNHKSKQKCSRKFCFKTVPRSHKAKAAANGDHWWFVIGWGESAADLMAGQPTTPLTYTPQK